MTVIKMNSVHHKCVMQPLYVKLRSSEVEEAEEEVDDEVEEVEAVLAHNVLAMFIQIKFVKRHPKVNGGLFGLLLA